MTQIEMTWENFEYCVHKLADVIKQSKVKISNIYGTPRGGLVVATRLSHLLGLPLVVETWRTDSNTLWVDDIVDTGKTLEHVHENWVIAVLFWNTEAAFQPEFYALTKPKNSWIVFPWEIKDRLVK